MLCLFWNICLYSCLTPATKVALIIFGASKIVYFHIFTIYFAINFILLLHASPFLLLFSNLWCWLLQRLKPLLNIGRQFHRFKLLTKPYCLIGLIIFKEVCLLQWCNKRTISFPRVILLCLYREPKPKKPRRPHTTGPKPHQLKAPTPKTQNKTPTPKPQTPNHHKWAKIRKN